MCPRRVPVWFRAHRGSSRSINPVLRAARERNPEESAPYEPRPAVAGVNGIVGYVVVLGALVAARWGKVDGAVAVFTFSTADGAHVVVGSGLDVDVFEPDDDVA